MWKSLINAVVEAFAASDPVAYTYYLNAKLETERQADVTSFPGPSRRPALRAIESVAPAQNEVSA